MDAQFIYRIGESFRWAFAALFFVIGLCLGSFVNVCIWRLPKGLSLLSPGSSCPKCSAKIAWQDNIPLVSFLLLGGKCRACHQKISPQYFWGELFSGLVLTGLFLYIGLAPEFLWTAWLIFSLWIITFVDFEHTVIPDEVTLTGILAGWFFAYAFPEIYGEASRKAALGESVLGMIAGGGLIWITASIGDAVFKRESMGGGDLKLMAMIGCFLGVQGAVFTFFLAPFIALPFGLYQKYFRKIDTFAYGPFLAMSAVFNMFFSNWMLDVILR